MTVERQICRKRSQEISIQLHIVFFSQKNYPQNFKVLGIYIKKNYNNVCNKKESLEFETRMGTAMQMSS